MILPAGALTASSGQPAVWVLNEATHRAVLNPVRVAVFRGDGDVEISAGLAAGQLVVTAGGGPARRRHAGHRLARPGPVKQYGAPPPDDPSLHPQSPPVRGNPSTWAIRQRALMIYALLVILGAGLWSYATLGRSEDPPFTIKQMIVTLNWPGASADQVMHELSDPVERKLQELPWLDYTTSELEAR